MAPYCSMDEAILIMGAVQDGNTLTAADRVKILGNLRVATKRVNEKFRGGAPPFLPMFEPWLATVKLPITGERVSSWNNTLRLDRFLLELSGGISINGTTVANVVVYPDANSAPFTLLRLTDACQSWYRAACDTSGAPLQASVPGIWGFSTDYANAWLLVDALVVTAPATEITASATTFKVADVDGDDAYGMPVRISPGHLLKIDSEYLEVVATDATTQTVTVRRGVNGTTAATHLNAAPVYRWQVEEDVKRAVARQSGLMLARFGAYTTVEVQGMSEVRYPADWLQEVLAIMQNYANG